MGIFSDSTRIQWTHFGRKHRLNFSKEEIEYMDLFEAMMKKIYNERPEFDGLIAYNDHSNRQVIINNDSDLRSAMHQMKGKLKIYTTLPERGTLAAADMAHGRSNNHRSHSVPPPHSRYSPIQDNRAPSSLDYNYRTYDRHQNHHQNNQRQHTASFDAPPQRYERSHSSFSRGNNNNSPPSSYNGYGNNSYNNGRQVTGYQPYQPPQIPPTYQYNYSFYNNSNLPYPGPAAGPLMPQQNMYLNHYLNGMPPGQPPVHAHAYAARSGTTFIGPNKLLASSWGYPMGRAW
jgi:hypothetical protein